MPRKRTGYDAACYYDGKLLGRCTKADSDAYTLLMNACGGDAARVLREYAYFSSELRAILEKAALMQADRSRTGGMFHAPKSSPWGEVQSCETLCPGVFLVSTASHGGTMVANEVAAVLSPAAKKCGFKDKGYICYEEDAQESVVLRELLDKKLWNIPDRIKDKGQFEEKLNQSIRQYNPEYWRARQSGREAAEAALVLCQKKYKLNVNSTLIFLIILFQFQVFSILSSIFSHVHSAIRNCSDYESLLYYKMFLYTQIQVCTHAYNP